MAEMPGEVSAVPITRASPDPQVLLVSGETVIYLCWEGALPPASVLLRFWPGFAAQAWLAGMDVVAGQWEGARREQVLWGGE